MQLIIQKLETFPLLRLKKNILKRIATIVYLIGFVLLTFGQTKQQTTDDSQNIESITTTFFQRYFHKDSIKHETHHLSEKELLEQKPLEFIEEFIQYIRQNPIRDYEAIISLADESLNIINTEKYPQEKAKLFLIKGITYLQSGYYYVEAHQFLSDAVELFDIDKEPKYLALAYSQLGALWRNLQEYDKSLTFCTKSESIYRNAGYEQEAYNMRLNECIIYLETDNKEKVVEIIQADFPWAEKNRNNAYLEFMNVILGHYYISTNELDSAYLYFDRALKIDAAKGRKPYVLANLGEVFFKKGEYKTALSYLEKALPFTHQTNRLFVESSVYQMLSEIYDNEKNIPEAYNYLLKSTQLRDSLDLEEKANEIHRVQSKTELMNYQQQLQITQQQAEIDRTRLFLVILLFLFAIVIFLFLLFYQNRRRKLKELENKQLAQQLQLEELAHTQKIEEKEREIATNQLFIAEKSKVLEQLLEVFKPLYEANELSGSMWKKMNSFVNSNTQKENEWEKSKIHFEKVHPDFFKKLKEIAPDLSENELRVCAYSRIGMATKQIAEILSVTQRSVISSRYRIKKKLKLDEDVSLDDFTRNL